MFDVLLGFLSETPDRVEEVLRSVELPWLLRALLDFFATHPATAALLVLLSVGGLIIVLTSNRRQSVRFKQALKDREDTFPRRDWEGMGRLDATRLIEEAIALFGSRPEKDGLASHYAILGLLFLQRGDGPKAETMLSKAVELFESQGHREGIAFYAHHLSLLYRELGDYERALVMAERSAALYRSMGKTPDTADLIAELTEKKED